jgi:hypothetical protein
MLEMEASSSYFKLKRMIGESEETLPQKRKEMADIDRESKYDNTSSSGNKLENHVKFGSHPSFPPIF